MDNSDITVFANLIFQGKEVFLQIQGLELRLLDPRSSIVLSVQQINKIRVWGIGKENER